MKAPSQEAANATVTLETGVQVDDNTGEEIRTNLSTVVTIEESVCKYRKDVKHDDKQEESYSNLFVRPNQSWQHRSQQSTHDHWEGQSEGIEERMYPQPQYAEDHQDDVVHQSELKEDHLQHPPSKFKQIFGLGP